MIIKTPSYIIFIRRFYKLKKHSISKKQKKVNQWLAQALNNLLEIMYYQSHYRIYPLADYTSELAAEHGMHQYETPFTVEYLNQLSDDILGEYAIAWEGEHD